MAGMDFQPLGDFPRQLLRMFDSHAVIRRLVRQQPRVAPDRHAVGAPIRRHQPTRQRLARIPLALPVMADAAEAETVL